MSTADVPTADAAPPRHDEPRREPGFLLTGYALTGGVALWIIHLVASSALVAPACTHDLVWVINVLTVVTALATVGAIAAGERLRHRYARGEGSRAGRMLLLADLAIIFNVASLALIVLEGYPVLVIDACSR